MAHILIVDDELSIRITLSEFLRNDNYEVDVAEDADQAMEMLATEDFDVVVTDIVMPRITGVKLLEAIRESAPRVQVILMTGEPTVETASKAVRADAFDYLTKPISKGKLIRTVANAAKVKTLDDERRRLAEENLRYQKNLEQLVDERTQALRESEERLSEFIESATDSFTLWDAEFNLIEINPVGLGLLAVNREDVLGKNMLELSPNIKKTNRYDAYIKVLETGKPLIIEERVPHPKSGDDIYLTWKIFKVGSGLGMIASDVTERKKAQKNIAQLSRIFEDSLNEIFLFKADTLKFIQVNDAAQQNLGYTMEEFRHLTPLDIKPQFTDESFATLVASLLNREKEKIIFETLYQRKDGSLYDVEVHLQLLEHEEETLFAAIVLDITKRIQAAKALQRKHSELTLYNRIIATTSTSLNREDVLETICRALALALDVPQAAAALLNKTHTSSVVVAEYLAEGCFSAIDIVMPVEGNPILQYIIEHKVPLAITDIQNDSRFSFFYEALRQRGTVSMLILPLIERGEVVGTLGLDAIEKREFSEEEVALAVNAVAAATQSLENARLYQTIEYELSERKQMQEKIRLVRENQRILLDHIQIQVWYLKDECTYGVVNRTHADFCGIAVEKLAHSNIFTLFPKEAAKTKVKNNRKVFQTRQKHKSEIWVPNTSGEQRLLSILKTPELDQEGNVKFVVCSAEDITERKKAENNIQRHLSELEVLYENGLAISGLLEQKEIAQRVIEVLEKKLKWHHVAIRLYHSKSDQVELLGFNMIGIKKTENQEQIAHLNKMISSSKQGLSGWVIKHKKSLCISDLSKDKRYVASYANIKSGLYAPMMVGDEAIGSIAVESKKKNAFSTNDKRLLFTLANQAAISLENAKLYLEIQQELNERLLAEKNLSKLNLELEERVLLRTDEIESARRRLELATSAAGFGIWESMENTDTQFWDKQMYEIYGTSPNKYQPSFSNWLKFLSPEDREKIIKNRTQLFQNEIPYEMKIEYGITRADNSSRQIATHAIMLFDEKEQCKKLVGIDMDITAAKEAEKILHLANTKLAHALRIKDEFLANMSHELRTPLNAIMGLSESLIEETAGPINKKQGKYLKTVNESGHHLLSLINDILDLAKIESGEVLLHIEKVSLQKICEASIRMLKQQSQKKNQKIIYEFDENINNIWADERRLKQIIVNLLSNAIKFTPQGGNLGVKVNAEHKKDIIRIKIWDEGIGIDKKDQAQIFTPFVQIDSGLARKEVGTGLGLALVKQLVDLHNGHIRIESTPTQGSAFTIHLPSKRVKDTDKLPYLAKDNKEKEKQVSGIGKSILLVEDTEALTMMIKDFLEKNKYQVFCAKNGIESISKSKKHQPNLILMDVMMPLMDGFEATKKIKAEPELKKIPIIGLTALAMPEDHQKCLEAGMDDYMSKPVILDELLSIIEKYL